MKDFSRNALACLMLLLAGSGVNACELPAHPNAAAMPVSITPKGGQETSIKNAQADGIVKLISDSSNGSFYYLIPEGSKVKMKIVWDPLCHNSGATGKDLAYKKEQYDYLNDGHIAGVQPDKEVDAAGGYNFFPLSAMSEFFKVSGNRNDIEEAFGREMNVSTENKIVPDEAGVGPGLLYTNTFSKASTELMIEVTSAKSANYKDAYTEKAVLGNDEYNKRPIADKYEKTESLNKALPGLHHNLNVAKNTDGYKLYILENDKLTLQKLKDGTPGFSAARVENSEDLIKYTESGLEVRDISIELETPKYEDYKAYIVRNPNDQMIHVKGIDYNSESPIADGRNNGYFDVVFTTPSIDGDGTDDNAILKIKVNSPAAGYKMNNVFWVWKEQYYERVKPTDKLPVVGDSDITELDCSNLDDKTLIYKKKDKEKKCSCETKVTFNKAQDAFGFSGYKIYDNCGPISTKLELTDEKENLTFAEKENESAKTTLKYKISLIDSNPFFAKEIKATENEFLGKGDNQVDISQNLEKMQVTFFYNYPVYDYKPQTIDGIDKLNAGCGLVDFTDDNKKGYNAKFKTYNHDLKWCWKKAVDVKVDNIKLDETFYDSNNRVIGSRATITGTFTIDNPKPWHVTDNNPETSAETNFSVFAILKDTAGRTHLAEIYNSKSTEKDLESADPTNFNTKYAVYPTDSNSGEIPANVKSTAPYLCNEIETSESDWDTSKWQEREFIKSDDKTAPEIQVIVLDTRTNRYHIFGTKANVAADFNKFAETKDTDYADKINNVPYIGKNTAISESYHYASFDNINELYEKYLKGTDAVTTIENTSVKDGFVCQKGTRLVFYAHAFDNIGYNTQGGNLNTFKIKLVDEINNKEITSDKGEDPLEYVFRQENYDKDGNNKQGKSYKLIVTASDKVNNEREFELEIAVLGRLLDIRTLEEKRERVE